MPRVDFEDAIFWHQVGPGHLRGMMTLNGKEYACDVAHRVGDRMSVAQAQHLIAARFRIFVEEKAATLTVRDLSPKPAPKAEAKPTVKKKPGPKPKAEKQPVLKECPDG